MENINLQLYSFGFEPPRTLLEKIKITGELGYSGVEFAGGYEDLPVETVKKALEDAHLKAVSAHVGLHDLDPQLDYLAELGVKYIIVAGTPFNTPEEAKEVAEVLNAFGKKSAARGIKPGYHNHTDEFYPVEGKPMLDWLMEYTDPEYVVFEIDCGWASAAGTDPVDYINAHKGRVAAIHIKENNAVIGYHKPNSRHEKYVPPKFELDENGKPILPEEFIKAMKERDKLNCPQGQGIVDWKAVKAAADAQFDGVTYIVEREASYNDPADRVACLKEDLNWLKANL